MAAGVVLVVRPRPLTHGEVAFLSAKAPDHLAPLAVYLVDGGGPAGRDEQVSVVVYVHGVDVEVVERRLEIGWWFEIRLFQGHVLQAVPLEEDLAGPDVDLLDYTVEHGAVRRAPYGGEV